MLNPLFVIKGINKGGIVVNASETMFSSIHRAELASLDFYGDSRFKIVWVERQGYGSGADPQHPRATSL